jgi:HD-GYP domain-containing protein (c-di-GMP phosphodiesterase class II)
VPHLDIARNIIAAHHENMDGTGYPKGLAGTAIPLEGRIVAVADVFDALTSDRPYRNGMSFEDAFAILRRGAGTELDTTCVEALWRARQKGNVLMQRERSADSI